VGGVLSFASYPTPLQRLESLSSARTSVWVKRDDATSSVYGGNKVRKLERLLADAQARGAERVVTVGALGSHHVLATGVFGRSAGLRVEAVLVPQPDADQVLMNVRADIALGVTLFPATSFAHAAVRIASRLGRRAYYIPAGGSNRIGSAGFVDAAKELAAQVRDGAMPEPDLVTVALGSGGTAAGLAAGFVIEGMRTRVLAVTVAEPAWLVERMVMILAKQLVPRSRRDEVAKRLEVSRRYIGMGYGHPTSLGLAAIAEGAKAGLVLDPTYTAKAFAATMERAREGRERTILYWHTLSSAPMAPLLAGAPDEAAIPDPVRRLVRTPLLA
jgi:1-aminocyclopropane-1-carboxylate deaminase/D-cysteine desulfhydrase-like pyridoxal-dependent ACC family enzyme